MDAVTRPRRTRTALTLALIAVLALLMSACGGGGDDVGEASAQGASANESASSAGGLGTSEASSTDSTAASTPKGDATDDEASDAGESTTVTPVTAQYGDVEVTVESAEVVPTLSDEQQENAPIPPEASSYAVIDLTFVGLVEDLPVESYDAPALVHLDVDGETIEGVSYALDLQGTTPASLLAVYPLDEPIALEDAVVRIQEDAATPDEAKRPVEIPLDGTDPTPVADPIPLTPDVTEVAGVGTTGDTVTATFVSADLSTNVGTEEDGTAWPTTVPSRGYRQAREGQVYLRVALEFTSVDDTQTISGGLWDVSYVEDGEVAGTDVHDPGGAVVDETDPPVEESWVFEVPEGRDTYEISFGDAGSIVLTP